MTQPGITYNSEKYRYGFNRMTVANSIILSSDEKFYSESTVIETAESKDADVNEVKGITHQSGQNINIPNRSKDNMLTILNKIFHTLYYDNDDSKEGLVGGYSLPEKKINSSMLNSK